MTLTKVKRQELIIAAFFFCTAVALGAFGAHGLKAHLSEKAMAAYQTGVHYQFYHAIAMFITSFIGSAYNIEIQRPWRLFLIGITFFSGFCYMYAILGIPKFAMFIPIGGVCFIIGWILLILKLFKSETK